MLRSVIAGLILSFTAVGCSSGLPPSLSHSFDVASQELDQMLAEPAIIAATAALVEQRIGELPRSQFALLGSTEARTTGLQSIKFSRFDVAPDGDNLQISYTLLPTQTDPTERIGELTIHPQSDDQVTAKLLLTRKVDPDHGGAELDIAQDDQLAVRRLSGNLRINFADTPDQERPYIMTFTPSPGHEYDARREIREGYQVVVSE